jgi:hypothetical protein
MWEMQIMQDAIICQGPLVDIVEAIPEDQFDQRISW